MTRATRQQLIDGCANAASEEDRRIHLRAALRAIATDAHGLEETALALVAILDGKPSSERATMGAVLRSFETERSE
jgi:hypothetical protein